MPIKLSSLAPSPKGRRLLASMPFIATCHVAKRLQMTSINLSNYLRHLSQGGANETLSTPGPRIKWGNAGSTTSPSPGVTISAARINRIGR